MFQSTHPRGVRRSSLNGVIWGSCFNPRTREGCDVLRRVLSLGSLWFQSTHPRGVRQDGMPANNMVTIEFQSTHPRGVRHIPWHGYDSWSAVSIHAPARGATADALLIVYFLAVSIHAPARGATLSTCQSYLRHRSFNPRTREGCDV